MTIYRHSFVLTEIVAFIRGYIKNLRQVSPVHPTCDGCCVLICDDTNGVVYRLSMDIVHSEIFVQGAKEKTLMLSDIMKAWDGNNGKS